MNSKSVMTWTYGDRAEAHVGMEIHGVGAVEGYSVDEVHDFHHIIIICAGVTTNLFLNLCNKSTKAIN